MSDQPEKFLCKKCGSTLALFLDIDCVSYEPVINDDGTITISNPKCVINDITGIECNNWNCGATDDETGWMPTDYSGSLVLMPVEASAACQVCGSPIEQSGGNVCPACVARESAD